jgi:hypothetical protein
VRNAGIVISPKRVASVAIPFEHDLVREAGLGHAQCQSTSACKQFD